MSDDLFCLHLDAISVQIPSQCLSDDLRWNIFTNLLQCLGVLPHGLDLYVLCVCR